MAEDFDIITITETGLTEGFNDAELFDDRYDVYRQDRSDGRRGGGVLIASKKSFNMQCIPINCDNFAFECLLVKIKVKKRLFYLCCVYIPPNVNIEQYCQFFNMFESILDKEVDIFIVGDFNLPCYEVGGCNKSNLLNNFLYLNNLVQCNTIYNDSQRKLDLVLSNMEILKLEKCENALIKEDVYHPALDITLCLGVRESNCDSTIQPGYVYDYAKGNFDILYRLIRETDWSDIQQANDVNISLDLFYKKISNCIEKTVPKKQLRVFSGRAPKYPIFFSPQLKRDIKLKNRLHKQIKNNKASFEDIGRYRELRNIIKEQTATDFELYHESIENNINTNANNFWNFINSRKKKPNIPSELSYNGKIFSDPQDKADAFAQHFSSIFHKSDRATLPTECYGNFVFPSISVEQVKASIKKLKQKKATGSDNIPSYIYKGCSDFLCTPLVKIFNLSIINGIFPDRLKEASITPIFKSGNRNEIENYRPISVLNSLSKIFENILYDIILNEFQNSFASQQHGFLPNLSTVTNLCTLTEAAGNAINRKEQLDVIMTDFSKAFDKVDHGLLVTKLGRFGFSFSACKFMETYLNSRSQQVKIDGCFSKTYLSTSGVPQGSNLGPLLFVIFVNDLPNCAEFSQSLLFADDFKVYKHITKPSDCDLLQKDLNSVAQWATENKMPLNTDKCLSISFTRRFNYINYEYSINNQILVRKNQCRDLGVQLQSNLKYNQHYENITNKAYKLLGFIIRNTKYFKNVKSIIYLYNAIVRPHLEYASVIWSPQTETHNNMIEKVQKRFLRYLHVRKHNEYPFRIAYNSMLVEFDLVRLSQRRMCNNVLFIYHILNNTKHKKCSFINEIGLIVPKVNLRRINTQLFLYLPHSCSPINGMLGDCNILIKKSDIDFCCDNVNAIKNAVINMKANEN